MRKALLCFGLLAGLSGLLDACCSMAPAHFSKTRVLAAEVVKDGKVYHLLGYQNTAQNLVKAKPGQPTGNAMLLPLPAVGGSVKPENILDTTSGPHILEDMETAARPPVMRSKGVEGYSKTRSSEPVQVFNHDVYTIVLARDARDIAPALKRVPKSRRPAMNADIFAAYQRWYPGWTFALCCFDVRQETQAKPMLWYYTPKNPKQLFVPGLDAHDGKPPNLKAEVDVDHFLLVSSNRTSRARTVRYTDPIKPQLRNWLPERVIGATSHGRMQNGDWFFDVEDVRAGEFRPQRLAPKG